MEKELQTVIKNKNKNGLTNKRLNYLFFFMYKDDLMLAACRNDQDEMLEEVLKEGDFDINYADGIGDTPCHYA